MRHRLLLVVRRSVAVLAAGLLAGVVGASPAAAEEPAFSIDTDEISAPVGMATDTATSSYWVVNDTGADMFALSRTGRVKGTVDFRAEPVDVQAAAYRSGRLYVGDIGDSDRNRESVTVFSFPNLSPDSGTVTYQSWDLAYPDGEHDAKAMLVDTSGRLYLITSGDQPGIYAAPEQPSRQGVNALERVADAPAGVTDAVALSADRWALRTATAVQEIDAESYKKVAERSLPMKDGDTLGIDLAASSGPSIGLVAGSAGASADVYAVDVPSVAPSPSASRSPSTPKATATAGTPGAGDQDPAEDSASDSSRSGTVLAVGLAALIAVLAGAAAYLWPGRRAQHGVAPVRAAPPPPASHQPPMERPVAAPRRPASVTTAPTVWPETPRYHAGARASVDPHRSRPPGDIEDDDPFDDTTVRADQRPGRHSEAAPPVAPAEPPRRSPGYDPELWGEETLRRRPVQQPPDDGFST